MPEVAFVGGLSGVTISGACISGERGDELVELDSPKGQRNSKMYESHDVNIAA